MCVSVMECVWGVCGVCGVCCVGVTECGCGCGVGVGVLCGCDGVLCVCVCAKEYKVDGRVHMCIQTQKFKNEQLAGRCAQPFEDETRFN